MTPDPDLVRDFVISGHGNFERIQSLLEEHPQLRQLDSEFNSLSNDMSYTNQHNRNQR